MVQHREREISFDVDERWVAPDLTGLVPEGGRLAADQADLQASYFDTDGEVLRRLGVTLRRRTGGGDAGWHLKIPSGSARMEIQSKSRGRWVPAALSDPLRGALVDRPLRQVATITTDRRILAVRDADDQLVVEIADDHVTATAAQDARSQRWREVEAELGSAGSEEFLRSVTKQLKRSGARRSATQVKLDRALGPLNSHGDGSGPALVVQYVSDHVAEVLRGDIALRMGTEPDAIRDMRVAIRRIRSVIRGYGSVFDDSVPRLAQELQWLGGVLGEIRDLDVVADTVRADLAVLPAELVLGPVAAGVEEAVAADRAAAVERWHQVRDGDRYRQLLITLVDWLQTVPVREPAKPGAKRVQKSAKRRLRRRLDEVGRDPEALHRAHEAAERLRCAAEVISATSRAARRTAKKAKDVQRLLGAHQDQIVAERYLRELGARYGTTTGHNGFTYGLLTARAGQHAADLRRRLDPA